MQRKEEQTQSLLAEVLVRLDRLGSRTPSPRVLEDLTHDRAEGAVALPQGARTCPTLSYLGTVEHSLEGVRRSERSRRGQKCLTKKKLGNGNGPPSQPPAAY